MNWLATFILLITLCLGVFFIQLYAYYYLQCDSIKHQEVLSYLLLTDNSGFIKIESFTLFEKRHLLDVKILLNNIQQIFILGVVLSLAVLFIFHDRIKSLFYRMFFIFVIFGSILLLLILIDFPYFFEALHPYFFTEGSWLFNKESHIIILFPIIYFQQFSIIYIVMLGILFVSGYYLSILKTS